MTESNPPSCSSRSARSPPPVSLRRHSSGGVSLVNSFNSRGVKLASPVAATTSGLRRRDALAAPRPARRRSPPGRRDRHAGDDRRASSSRSPHATPRPMPDMRTSLDASRTALASDRVGGPSTWATSSMAAGRSRGSPRHISIARANASGTSGDHCLTSAILPASADSCAGALGRRRTVGGR